MTTRFIVAPQETLAGSMWLRRKNAPVAGPPPWSAEQHSTELQIELPPWRQSESQNGSFDLAATLADRGAVDHQAQDLEQQLGAGVSGVGGGIIFGGDFDHVAADDVQTLEPAQ